MNLFLVSVFFSCFSAALDANTVEKFIWPEHDTRFDFILGITADDEPAAIGSLIKFNVVLTSANPLESYLTKIGSLETAYRDPGNRIKVYTVYKSWKSSIALNIDRFAANVSKRNKTWIKMGFDRTHSPIHDLLFIILEENNTWIYNQPYRNMYKVFNKLNSFQNGWTFAGFGYVDDEHVKNNTLLETHTYDDSDEVDCDEWIPRAWGRFVCLLNVGSVVGVQSGAPLMYNGELRGVGCFALKKGKESILVFTDFGLYRQVLEGYIHAPPTPPEPAPSRTTATIRKSWPYEFRHPNRKQYVSRSV